MADAIRFRGVTVFLETPRLRIRELVVEDAEFVLRLVNDPAFIANIADKGIRTLDEARTFLREGAWTNQAMAGHGLFRVETKDDGVPVGVCGLVHREVVGVSDVGFALLEEHRGRGIALEAAEAVLDYGYHELHLAEIVGLTSPDNHASIRVLEKLGMRFDRVIALREGDPGTALYR